MSRDERIQRLERAFREGDNEAGLALGAELERSGLILEGRVVSVEAEARLLGSLVAGIANEAESGGSSNPRGLLRTAQDARRRLVEAWGELQDLGNEAFASVEAKFGSELRKLDKRIRRSKRKDFSSLHDWAWRIHPEESDRIKEQAEAEIEAIRELVNGALKKLYDANREAGYAILAASAATAAEGVEPGLNKVLVQEFNVAHEDYKGTGSAVKKANELADLISSLMLKAEVEFIRGEEAPEADFRGRFRPGYPNRRYVVYAFLDDPEDAVILRDTHSYAREKRYRDLTREGR